MINVELISEVLSRFSKVFKLVLTFISTSGLLLYSVNVSSLRRYFTEES
jgi:putative copper export protein